MVVLEVRHTNLKRNNVISMNRNCLAISENPDF